MRAVLACVILNLLTVAYASAQEDMAATPLEAIPVPAVYTVVPGDTLWDIAAKLYQNPYMWSTLWQANRTTISDPNHIYPAQVIMTRPSNDTAAVPVPAPVRRPEPRASAAADTAAAGSARAVSESPDDRIAAEDEFGTAAAQETDGSSAVFDAGEADRVAAQVAAVRVLATERPQPAPPRPYGADGFVATKYWNGDGLIVGDKDKKLMLSDGDTVFLNLGDGLVAPGARCAIYRRLKKVRNPDDGALLGVEVRVLGTLVITHADSPQSSTARITQSREPIAVGDIVRIID